MSDKIWSDGLTGEQVETVERAAKAAHETKVPPEKPCAGNWELCPNHYREVLFAETLAALRAINVIPPPKVQSRGEAVAEKMVPAPVQGSNEVFIYEPPEHGYAILLYQGQGYSGSANTLRKYIARAIDFEIAAALDLAAKLVTDGYGSRADRAKAILALKGAAHV